MTRRYDHDSAVDDVVAAQHVRAGFAEPLLDRRAIEAIAPENTGRPRERRDTIDVRAGLARRLSRGAQR